MPTIQRERLSKICVAEIEIRSEKKNQIMTLRREHWVRLVPTTKNEGPSGYKKRREFGARMKI